MHKLLIIHPDHKLHGLYRAEASKFFNIDSAYDGIQGMRMIKQNKPDLILSEYDLPIISGASLLTFVRGHSEMYSTPFIFLSSQAPEPASLGLGANEWMMVSEASPEVLITACHRHLKLNQLIYV